MNTTAENTDVKTHDTAEDALKEQVIAAIQSVYDPEIPVNIWELGLIYDVRLHNGKVEVDMTLTAPACPVAGTLPGEVADRIKMLDGIEDAHVELVWDPPWDQSMMSEEAQLELGLI